MARAKRAARKAFDIAELREMILENLTDTPKKLLLIQRVNKSFGATIARSSKIQKALFFKPRDANDLTADCMPHTNKMIVNIVWSYQQGIRQRKDFYPAGGGWKFLIEVPEATKDAS